MRHREKRAAGPIHIKTAGGQAKKATAQILAAMWHGMGPKSRPKKGVLKKPRGGGTGGGARANGLPAGRRVL